MPCHRSLPALCLATALSPLFFASPPPHHHAAASPGNFGIPRIRARPSGGFSAEIRFRGMRLGLGNFDTANEAARAYDAAVWRLRWPHRTLNIPNVPTRERVQELVPLPRLSTNEDRRDNRRREHHLGIAEMDEEAMALWRQHFP